jgi:hypothetical protein
MLEDAVDEDAHVSAGRDETHIVIGGGGAPAVRMRAMRRTFGALRRPHGLRKVRRDTCTGRLWLSVNGVGE